MSNHYIDIHALFLAGNPPKDIVETFYPSQRKYHDDTFKSFGEHKLTYKEFQKTFTAKYKHSIPTDLPKSMPRKEQRKVMWQKYRNYHKERLSVL